MIRILLAVAAVLPAADWPHWLGPRLDGTSPETGLAAALAQAPPTIAWRGRTPHGYAGLTAAGGCIFTVVHDDTVLVKDYKGSEPCFGQIHRRDKQTPVGTVLLCLDAQDGGERWRQTWTTPCTWMVNDWGKKDLADGPWSNYFGQKSPPTIHDGQLYVYDFGGSLRCFDAATGAPRWQRDVRNELAGHTARFGHVAPPLIVDDLVVVPGFGERILAAYDRRTGEPRWQGGASVVEATGFRRWDGYSAPVLAEVAGRRQIIIATSGGVVAVDPADGRELWRHGIKTSTGEIVPAPLWWGGSVLVSSFYYHPKAVLIDLASGEPQRGWTTFTFGARLGNAVRWNDRIFTSDGSFKDATLRCLATTDGAARWSQTFEEVVEGMPKPARNQAALLAADGLLFAVVSHGLLVVASADSDTYTEIARLPLADPAVPRGEWWPPPALADGRLYCRSTTGDLVAIRLRP